MEMVFRNFETCIWSVEGISIIRKKAMVYLFMKSELFLEFVNHSGPPSGSECNVDPAPNVQREGWGSDGSLRYECDSYLT